MGKRRLISVMLAGMITAGVGTMAGCGNEDSIHEDGNALKNKDVYLVIDGAEGKTIHKGDYQVVFLAGGQSKYGAGLLELKLNCGKNYLTNADCYIFETTPAKDEYEDICEDCFSLDQNL